MFLFCARLKLKEIYHFHGISSFHKTESILEHFSVILEIDSQDICEIGKIGEPSGFVHYHYHIFACREEGTDIILMRRTGLISVKLFIGSIGDIPTLTNTSSVTCFSETSTISPEKAFTMFFFMPCSIPEMTPLPVVMIREPRKRIAPVIMLLFLCLSRLRQAIFSIIQF